MKTIKMRKGDKVQILIGGKVIHTFEKVEVVRVGFDFKLGPSAKKSKKKTSVPRTCQDDATCQQCFESYQPADSMAETYRRFCSRSCEDSNDAELGDNGPQSEEES